MLSQTEGGWLQQIFENAHAEDCVGILYPFRLS